MKSIREAEQLIRRFYVTSSAGMDERVHDDVSNVLRRIQESRSAMDKPNTRRILMRSRITKLATAAVVIIITAVIGLMYWPPGGELEIPAELAAMSVDELLEIHYGRAESRFKPSVVAAAVAKVLEELSPRQIMDIGKRYASQSEMYFGTERMAYEPPPVSGIIEASDFVVQAYVESARIDVATLKEAILRAELTDLSESVVRAKVIVDLRLLEGYPSLPNLDGDRLRLCPVFDEERLDAFQAGKEYLIALQQDGDVIWMLPDGGYGAEGLYPIDPESGIVGGFRNGPMPLDEAWEFFMDTYDAIHEGKEPSGEVLEYWLNKLESQQRTDFLTAVEYFTLFPEPPVAPELLGDIIEQHFDALAQAYRALIAHEESLPGHRRGNEWFDVFESIASTIYREIPFLTETLELLIRVADEPTVDRMLDLYQTEASSPESMFNKQSGYHEDAPRPLIPKLVRLTLKHPGPKRRKRFLRLYSPRPLPRLLIADDACSQVADQLSRTDGEDIDRLLMELAQQPAGFGIQGRSWMDWFCWEAMARRRLPEFREYLERFIADPNESDLAKSEDCDPDRLQYLVRKAPELLDQYYAPASPLAPPATLAERLQDLIERCKEGAIDGDVVALITGKQDPRFVPYLERALEEEVNRELLTALFACGQVQKAVEIGLAELEKPVVDDGNRWTLYRDLEKRASIIKFLGTTQQASVLPMIEKYSHEEYKRPYREIFAQLDAPPYCIDEPQDAAFWAMVQLGGESAIPQLKELYESDDIGLQLRAALFLYRLGDNSGYELLEHFVNHTERSVPEIEMRWSVDLAGGAAFHAPIASDLRSPRTDGLLLERLRRGVSKEDEHVLGSPFFSKYEQQLLPILVGHLSGKDRKSQRYTNDMLKAWTGQDFGFDPGRFVGQQDEAINKWTSYVERYLADTASPE